MAVPLDTTVSGLLKSADYNSRVSVWINGSQLLSGEYATRVLEEGDFIKILRLVAGG